MFFTSVAVSSINHEQIEKAKAIIPDLELPIVNNTAAAFNIAMGRASKTLTGNEYLVEGLPLLVTKSYKEIDHSKKANWFEWTETGWIFHLLVFGD